MCGVNYGKCGSRVPLNAMFLLPLNAARVTFSKKGSKSDATRFSKSLVFEEREF